MLCGRPLRMTRGNFMVSTKPAHRRPTRLAAALLALPITLVLAGAAPAAAQTGDPLAAAFVVAFNNPTNVAAQLAYAHAAEAAGKPEAAFPVYERVLALEPGNRDAQAGLRRIRTTIQPSRRETFFEFGANYETNPLRATSGGNPEFQLYGNLTGKYENTFGEQRWRTETRLSGTWHAEQTPLNYGFAGAITGPLVDIGANAALHVAGGASIASFGGRLFYTEAVGSLTAEAGANGAVQTLRMRAAWRKYDPFWVSDAGFWADITGKFIMPKVQTGAALVFMPWARLVAINGSAITGVGDPIEITPGKYIEAGGQVQYIRDIARGVSGSVSLSLNQREYSTDVVPMTTTPRRDFTLTPAVSIALTNLIAQKADVRFRYNFILNNSNDNAHDFQDHIFTIGIGGKF
jgi:hypothetical protein